MSIDIKLFEPIVGSKVFPLRGKSGGIASECVAYLVAEVNGKHYSFLIRIVPSTLADLESLDMLASNAINNPNNIRMFVTIFEEQIKSGTAHQFNIQGGDMGLGDHLHRIIV